MTLGERIAKWRTLWGLSQRELARRAEITNGALSQIELGNTSPQVVTLEKIARALSVSLETLMFQAPFSPSEYVSEGDCVMLPLPRGRLSRFALGSSLLWRFSLPENTRVELADALGINADQNGERQLFLFAGELMVNCINAQHRLLAGDAMMLNLLREASVSTDRDQTAEFILFASP